jgi:hypothetical protein
MPSPYCLIAIAGLCFSNPHVKAEVSNFGLGYTVVVTTDHYVVSHAGTDTIDMHDFRKSPRACVDKHCIGYHKHCETAGKGVACTYHLGIPGVVPDGVVTITADDEAALTGAEHEVTRIGEGYPLPFSTMTVRSDATEPPECPPSPGYTACVPP